MAISHDRPVVEVFAEDMQQHTFYPLRIGASIGPLAEVQRYGSGVSGLGRIGAFAFRRGARDTSETFALTCHHVLAADIGAPIYQPHIAPCSSGILLSEKGLNPIGWVADPGVAATHSYAYPGETEQPYFIDCAGIRLTLVPYATTTVRAARAHPLDIAGSRRLRVRLLGLHDSPRGEIVDVFATVPHEDGTECEGTLVIETLPGQPPFARRGDSGALVVDHLNRAVGLLWGVDLNRPTRAFACHLLPVLDRLGMVLLSRSAPLDRFKESKDGAT